MKLSEEVLMRLGLGEDATEEQLDEALIKQFSETDELTTKLKTTEDELKPLKEAAAKADRQKTFSEQFPDEAAELDEARKARLDSGAKTFSEQFSRIKLGEGDEQTTSTRGPSGIALDKMRATHAALASGDAKEGMKFFAETLEVLMSDKGIVDYGEKGSGRGKDETDVPTDHQDVAKQFSELAIAAQAKAGGADKLSWGDALAQVATEHPDLAKAYRGERVN